MRTCVYTYIIYYTWTWHTSLTRLRDKQPAESLYCNMNTAAVAGAAGDDTVMWVAAAAAASLTDVSWQYVKFPNGRQTHRSLAQRSIFTFLF